jgi:hypothetical protein
MTDPTSRTCTVAGCDRPRHSAAYCSTHDGRRRKYGSPLAHVPVGDLPRTGRWPARAPTSTCAVDGCLRSRGGRLMCSAHDARRRKYGDPMPHVPIGARHNVTLLTEPGPYGRYWYRNVDGYLVAAWPEHPVASGSGVVMLARVVLFEAIGPGEHSCDECGVALSWDRRPPDPLTLEADHRNGVRDDNDPTNLRPLCKSCNARDGMVRRLITAAILEHLPRPRAA